MAFLDKAFRETEKMVLAENIVQQIQQSSCQGIMGGLYLGHIRKSNRTTALTCLTEVNSLSSIYSVLANHLAPQRNTNKTAVEPDQINQYVIYLEMKNRDLVQRIRNLEEKMKYFEPYFPTIVKIVKDFESTEKRIDEKKAYLVSKYKLQRKNKLDLWVGAEKEVDVAKKKLDDILSDINE